METLRYNGFIGSIEVSIKDNCVHGKILFINDLVTYESDTPVGLKAKFISAVHDYIETCKDLEIEPLRSYSGSFNIRIDPEKHQELAIHAVHKESTINKVVNRAIENYLHQSSMESEIHNHNTYNIVVEKSYSDFISENIATKKIDNNIIQFGPLENVKYN